MGGEVVSYGYLADLRISPRSAQALRREWKAAYPWILQRLAQSDEARHPRFFLTAILDGNQRAMALLTRHLKGVRYVPVQPYVATLAYAPLPALPFRRAPAQWRSATPDDLPRVLAFLAEHARAAPLSEAWEEELPRRLASWPGFEASSLQLSFDPRGELRAVVPARFPRSRAMVVHAARWTTRAALASLRAIGVPRLEVPGALKLLYVGAPTFHSALGQSARADLFEQALRFLWRRVLRPGGGHALCFARYPTFGEPLPRLRGWAQVESPGTLYAVELEGAGTALDLPALLTKCPFPFELSTA
jgi:hypothetical protein